MGSGPTGLWASGLRASGLWASGLSTLGIVTTTFSHLIVAGGKIIAGPRSPASQAAKPTADSGMPANQEGIARRLAWLALTSVATARLWRTELAGWAASRALTADSLSGITLLLALCAAASLSGS